MSDSSQAVPLIDKFHEVNLFSTDPAIVGAKITSITKISNPDAILMTGAIMPPPPIVESPPPRRAIFDSHSYEHERHSKHEVHAHEKELAVRQYNLLLLFYNIITL
jgi:hypothetical protein